MVFTNYTTCIFVSIYCCRVKTLVDWTKIGKRDFSEVNVTTETNNYKALKMYRKAPQVGDVVLVHEVEKVNNLIKMLIAGPDVSLKGSPTVSPTTAALCCSLPLPP